MKLFSVRFSKEAWADYQSFLKNDRKTAERIVRLVDEIAINPFKGFGKPEPLKYKLTGLWSRRIDNKNRLIYRIIDSVVIQIVSCKGHY